MSDEPRYVPAAGRAGLTRFYDLGVRLTMRERQWRPLVVDAVADGSPQTVVDVGCGTGALSIPIAERLPKARVVGVDGDPEVLEIAREKPGADGVEWTEGLAGSLPLKDGEADVVVTSLVLHHLPLATKREMLAETHRVLRSGGRLIVADWAARLAAGPPIALGLTKRLLNDSYSRTLQEALEAEGMAQSITLQSKDTQDAFAAFQEKRDPEFTSKASQMPPFFPW